MKFLDLTCRKITGICLRHRHFIWWSSGGLYLRSLWRDVGRFTQKHEIMSARWWNYPLRQEPRIWYQGLLNIILNQFIMHGVTMKAGIPWSRRHISHHPQHHNWGYCFTYHIIQKGKSRRQLALHMLQIPYAYKLFPSHSKDIRADGHMRYEQLWNLRNSNSTRETITRFDYQSSNISEPWKGHTAVAWSAVHNCFPRFVTCWFRV
jgi:hypothetical protein